MFNTIFVGRLGRDAEIKESRNGGKFLTFSVATSGIKKDETYWADVVSSADNVIKLKEWLTKGRMVTVSGDVRAETYLDRNNVTQIAYRVNANRVDFVPGTSAKTESETATTVATTPTPAPSPKPAPAPTPVAAPAADPFGGVAEDDLPF